MASFNRKLKKQNEKRVASQKKRDEDLLKNYILEINYTQASNNEKPIVVTDNIVLENLDKFIGNFEEMGKQGKADFDKAKSDLAFAGINEILKTREIRVTTLRYLMLLMIFQLWDVTPFYNSDEFEDACENSNLKLLQNGFWSDNLYVIKYINKFFYFSFDESGTFEIKER